jgi:hypothetical protein
MTEPASAIEIYSVASLQPETGSTTSATISTGGLLRRRGARATAASPFVIVR